MKRITVLCLVILSVSFSLSQKVRSDVGGEANAWSDGLVARYNADQAALMKAQETYEKLAAEGGCVVMQPVASEMKQSGPISEKAYVHTKVCNDLKAEIDRLTADISSIKATLNQSRQALAKRRPAQYALIGRYKALDLEIAQYRPYAPQAEISAFRAATMDMMDLSDRYQSWAKDGGCQISVRVNEFPNKRPFTQVDCLTTRHCLGLRAGINAGIQARNRLILSWDNRWLASCRQKVDQFDRVARERKYQVSETSLDGPKAELRTIRASIKAHSTAVESSAVQGLLALVNQTDKRIQSVDEQIQDANFVPPLGYGPKE
ncbi:MAG: hypothetical protein V1798_04630 [Pseudomonadota bacterium]